MTGTIQARLRALAPQSDFFVGVDSDGCVFDSMALKQEQFFFPAIIATWGLEAIAPQVREVAGFVNLYSCWRGMNRFPALVKVLELLGEHPEVRKASMRLPDTTALRAYIASGLPLGNAALETYCERHPDPGLRRVLAWSEGLNTAIANAEAPFPPFAGADEALRLMAAQADVVVVSQTPEAALAGEWRQHGLLGCIRMIAGQEAGSKSEQLRLATDGKYPPGHVLMVGDAFGDRAAAADVGALFFPVVPGHEARSWSRFTGEAFPRFLAGTYAGSYERDCIREFEAGLPDTPPWERA